MPEAVPQSVDEVARRDAPVQPRASRLRRRSSIGKLQQRLTEHLLPVQTSLLAATIGGSLIAVGTVHVTTLLFVASLAMLSFALVCFTEKSWAARVPAPAWVLLGLSAYSLFQSLPLPFSWVQRWSPAGARVWLDARQLIGAPLHAATPLSLDPAASRVECLKWLTYAALLAACAQIARRAGAKRGLLLVVCAALLGGVLTIVHGLFGIDAWLGLYEPRYAHPPWALSPLLNPNNFCGYLNLASFSAIGLAMTRRPPAPRWALGLTAAILLGLAFLTASRGGVLALLIGIVLMAFALREQSRRARQVAAPALPEWLPLLGAALAGGTLFLLGSNENIWAQLLDETTSKFRIVEWTAPLIRDYFWFGVGRGAYETAAAAYRTESGLVTFQHAENFLADWVAEWGMLPSAAALVSFVWFLRPNKLGFVRHPIPTAALIGVLVLFLQNLVDLGLEVAAVGIALASVIGSLVGGSQRNLERRLARGQTQSSPRAVTRAAKTQSEAGKRFPRSPAGSRWAAASTLAIGVGIIVLVATTSRPDVLDQRRTLHDALSGTKVADRPKVVKLQQAIAAAISRHPADAYLPLLGAITAQRMNQNELVWLNQALRRDPLNARAELMLADSLAQRGARLQALGVLRRCAAHEPNLAYVVAERATHYSKKVDELALAAPDGPAGVATLNALAQYLSKPESRAAHDALLALALERQSNSASTHGLIIDDLLRDLESPGSPCAGAASAQCEAKLLQHAQVVEKQGPHNLQAVILRSRLLVREGKVEEAAQWLSDHCHEFTADTTCAAQWVTVAAKAKRPEPLEEASSNYLALACSTPDACGGACTWIANLFMARGNIELALTRFERAANEVPSADAWLRVADAALRSGHVNRAQSALMAARRFGDNVDPNLVERVEQARREQLLSGALRKAR